MNEVLIGAAASLITAIITWIFSRKKQAAEVASTNLDNINKATAIWQELAEKLKVQVDELLVGQEKIFKENRSLKLEIEKLEGIVKTLTSANRKLTKIISSKNNCDTKE